MRTYVLTILPKSSSQRAPATSTSAVPAPEAVVNMAPIEIHTSPSRRPLALLGVHVFLGVYLSTVAARTIYRSYIALPPSSATRLREPSRQRHVRIFVALAALSLAVAGFFAAKFGALSYRTWAAQRGVELPESLFEDIGGLRPGEHPSRLHLTRWLNDTSFYQDVLEIVAETGRYFWWGQQINLSMVSWSVYLAFEGRRRKIPHHWIFLALAQLVNLSYAQNLFFVAVLLTPVPLPDNVKEVTRTSVPLTNSRFSQLAERLPNKPDGWWPNLGFYILLVSANYGAIFLIPFAANTPSFMAVSLASRLIPFFLLALPYLVPISFGEVSNPPHMVQHKGHSILVLTTVFSAVLHLKGTILALDLHGQGLAQYSYRHSLLHPFHNERLSKLTRTSRIMGAVSEHPAVSAVGWDVILTGLCLGIWAGIRSLDPWEISGFWVFRRGATTIEKSIEAVIKQEPTSTEIGSPIRRRPGRPKKNEKGEASDEGNTSSLVKRRVKSAGKVSDDNEDADYQPSEDRQVEKGDEQAEVDLESAAMAWGTIIASGLGKGSAGILGAELKAM